MPLKRAHILASWLSQVAAIMLRAPESRTFLPLLQGTCESAARERERERTLFETPATVLACMRATCMCACRSLASQKEGERAFEWCRSLGGRALAAPPDPAPRRSFGLFGRLEGAGLGSERAAAWQAPRRVCGGEIFSQVSLSKRATDFFSLAHFTLACAHHKTRAGAASLASPD